MMLWYGNNTSGWGGILMTIGMVAFWGLLIAGVVVLVRSPGIRARRDQVPATSTPEQLLAERFARGEIDEAEYTANLTAIHGQVRS